MESIIILVFVGVFTNREIKLDNYMYLITFYCLSELNRIYKEVNESVYRDTSFFVCTCVPSPFKDLHLRRVHRWFHRIRDICMSSRKLWALYAV